ncbi:MAG: hypothetical protein CMH54_04030 [Myxococcales bacterium]|nr:hypothetical protein [Myxococcales bacterium]|tara:strand:- start:897 stop:1517 length:621 start_codon:yes stop_codon:yes gene_type:complete
MMKTYAAPGFPYPTLLMVLSLICMVGCSSATSDDTGVPVNDVSTSTDSNTSDTVQQSGDTSEETVDDTASTGVDVGTVGEEDSMPSYELEIAGLWIKESSIPTNPNDPIQTETVTITDEMWGVLSIHHFDNEANHVILQSPSNDPFFGDLFHKTIWLEIQDDTFYNCQVVQGVESYDLAMDGEGTVDENDMLLGCNGGPWQKLTRQ